MQGYACLQMDVNEKPSSALEAPTPPYLVVAQTIKKMIEDGELRTNDQIPSIRAFATALGVAENTVKAAYRLLEQERIVINQGLKGRYVAPRPKAYDAFRQVIVELKRAKVSTRAITDGLQRILEEGIQ